MSEHNDNIQNIDNNIIINLYKKMLLIRKVEQYIADIYHTDVIKSPVHLSIGQESIAAAICEALDQKDYISNTYRCHAGYIAKNGNLNTMMAELYGKIDGCAGGKAGSMHLVDMANGILGATAVVATNIPVAAGYALGLKQQKKNQVVAIFFGDGATEEGCFLETINFAALHKLPILFICENNKLAIHTPIEKRWATNKICERVATYDIKTHKYNKYCVLDLYTLAKQEINNIKNNNNYGPVFIECDTYRWLEHVGPSDDHNVKYRSQEEYSKWQVNDQILALEQQLNNIDNTKAIIKDINQKIDEQIKQAILFAEKSPFPQEKELYKNVYA